MSSFKYNEQRVLRLKMTLGVVPLNAIAFSESKILFNLIRDSKTSS